jgi:hypothetical protein
VEPKNKKMKHYKSTQITATKGDKTLNQIYKNVSQKAGWGHIKQ